jgi:tetratricopeptide (TPR) repeat protein
MRPEHSHGPTFKHLLFLLLMVFTSGWGLAQADGVLIEGELRHKKTRDPLQNVTVTVMVGDDIVDSFEADGRYSYEVPHDGDYVLLFGAIDMVPQSVQVNASQVPEALQGELDALTWPVMLFDYVEGFDMSVVDEPFGIFDFDEDRESMEFDRSHSSQMRGALDDEMERLGNQGREAERNQRYYEYAMEDAQKAERKGRWAAAKEEYEEALGLKPGDAEAAAGLERANLALNPELADDEVIEEEPPAEESQSPAEDVLPEVQDQEKPEATSSRASSQDANDEQLTAPVEEEGTEEIVDDRPDDSTRDEPANKQGGASVLSAPAVPIRTVSAKELSDAEDAEEYFRQARIAEKQAELNQIRQKNRTLNEVDRQVAVEANKLADEAMVQTVQMRRLAQEIDEAVSFSHQASILEHRTETRAHEAVEAERVKTNAERTADEIVELRSLQAAQRTRPDRPFLDPEMDDVPQGVTQTNQKMPNGEGIVITRIVRVGNVIKRYRKVITKLGTFYYCGDRSITKTQWGLETNLTH